MGEEVARKKEARKGILGILGERRVEARTVLERSVTATVFAGAVIYSKVGMHRARA